MHDRRPHHRLPLAAFLLFCSCSQSEQGLQSAVPPVISQSEGLILLAGEGERRVRRTKAAGVIGLPDPFILKIDRRNGGSQDLVMGYEELAPGQAISAHRHVLADEIIFIHKGAGLVTLGSRDATVATGSTVYIPRNVRIALKNTGSEPLGIAFIFSKPGFEELMRENSALEGEPVTVLTAEEQAAIQARHKWLRPRKVIRFSRLAMGKRRS